MDERIKPGQLHETPTEMDQKEEHSELSDAEHDNGMKGMSTHRDDESGSTRAQLRRERDTGGTRPRDDSAYGKVRTFPSQT